MQVRHTVKRKYQNNIRAPWWTQILWLLCGLCLFSYETIAETYSLNVSWCGLPFVKVVLAVVLTPPPSPVLSQAKLNSRTFISQGRLVFCLIRASKGHWCATWWLKRKRFWNSRVEVNRARLLVGNRICEPVFKEMHAVLKVKSFGWEWKKLNNS